MTTAFLFTAISFSPQAGVLFVLAADDTSLELGRYQMAASTGDGQFITTATWSKAANLLFVSSPSDAPATSVSATTVPGIAHGLSAFNVSGPSCKLTLVWQSTLGLPWNSADLGSNAPYTSPVVAGDVVYVGTGFNKKVVAVAASNGTMLWSATLKAPIFSAPIVASGRIYASDWSYGIGHVYGFW